MRRTSGGAVLCVAVATSLTACATAPAAPSGTAAPTARPSELVGLWKVSGARGEVPATWLRLDVDDLLLFRPCGELMGSWRAAGSAFVGSIDGWSSACTARNPEAPWLDDTRAYRVDGDGVVLLDADGDVVATLTTDGAPVTTGDIAADLTGVPTPAPSALAVLDRAAVLPQAHGATAAELEGAWAPVGFDGETEPGVTFDADGKYVASDGCNGTTGRWSVTDRGAFVATSGPTTLVACVGVGVGTWVAEARSVAWEGSELVLRDVVGSELGRLRPR